MSCPGQPRSAASFVQIRHRTRKGHWPLGSTSDRPLCLCVQVCGERGHVVKRAALLLKVDQEPYGLLWVLLGPGWAAQHSKFLYVRCGKPVAPHESAKGASPAGYLV